MTNEPFRPRKLDTVILVIGASLYILIQVILANAQRHDNDFKHIYLGMQALTEREEPYSAASLLLQAGEHGLRNTSLNPYVYLPFTGLTLAFLKPVSFPAAALAWFIINHVLAVSSLWLIGITLFPVRRTIAVGILLSAAALNYPFLRSFTAGQLNIVLLFCYAASFAKLARHRDTFSGFILGFAALFKLAPALFALFFILQRRWRALLSMAAICLVLMSISVAAVGIKIHADFLPMLKQMGYGHSTWEQHNAIFWKEPANQSINSLATHLLVADNKVTTPWLNLTQLAANRVTIGLTVLLVVLFLLRARLLPHRPTEFTHRDQALFLATMLLSLLIPSLLWDHYLCLLILPVVWLVKEHLARRQFGLLSFTGACWALTAIPWHFDAPMFLKGPGILLMSMKLFPTIAFFVLLLHSAAGSNEPVKVETP